MDISVVIPLYNEDESLKELNDWIVRVMQSNHFSFELIYIDDGSTDNSFKIITFIVLINYLLYSLRKSLYTVFSLL